MAKSLAFWLGRDNTIPNNQDLVEDAEIELHFNYWSLNSNSNKELNYLDVGVKLTRIEPDHFKSLNIFFPFQVDSQKYFANLGRVVCGNEELISAIFNTRTHSKVSAGEVTKIVFQDQEELFFCNHIELGNNADEEVSFGSIDGLGTTISFPVRLFNNTGSNGQKVPCYFRFRIKMSQDDKKVLSQIYKPKDAKLISHLESTEIVDFRVNEIRNLPALIRSKLDNNQYIKSVHFFLIREADSEYKLSHADFKRCRLLEKDLWNAYLNIDDSSKASIPEQMLIYHWKEPAKNSSSPTAVTGEGASLAKFSEFYVEKFSAFAKFSKTTVSWITIGWFVFIIVFLGVVSGVIAGYAYDNYFKPLTGKDIICFLHKYYLFFLGLFVYKLLTCTYCKRMLIACLEGVEKTFNAIKSLKK